MPLNNCLTVKDRSRGLALLRVGEHVAPMQAMQLVGRFACDSPDGLAYVKIPSASVAQMKSLVLVARSRKKARLSDSALRRLTSSVFSQPRKATTWSSPASPGKVMAATRKLRAAVASLPSIETSQRSDWFDCASATARSPRSPRRRSPLASITVKTPAAARLRTRIAPSFEATTAGPGNPETSARIHAPIAMVRASCIVEEIPRPKIKNSQRTR